MIVEMKMYGCKCDNCGQEWADWDSGNIACTDASSMKDIIVDDSDWYVDGEKHYCKKCWSWDEDDNLVLKEIKKL